MVEHTLPNQFASIVQTIVTALQREIDRHASQTEKIVVGEAKFTPVIDPSNLKMGYEGIWHNQRNERCGVLNINSEGHFYAEYDMFCPHPHDSRWIVEMITAWGKGDSVRCEAKLIPQLEA